jgi:hypothetical protein
MLRRKKCQRSQAWQQGFQGFKDMISFQNNFIIASSLLI